MFGSVKTIHMIGIGGIGMCGLAEILSAMNFTVTGSDRGKTEITEKLESIGIKVFIGHNAKNLDNADLVVYTSAVNTDNEELKEAKRKNIPAIKRAEMLGELIRFKKGIGIAGTHGKTSTSGMVSLVLQEASFDPTIIVGGLLKSLDGNTARLGNGDYTVVEADEFDRSFLKLSPVIAAITNIEKEHLDTYKDFDDIKKTFSEYANKVPFYGFVVLCLDDAGVKEVLPSINRRVITYGLNSAAIITAKDVAYDNSRTSFNVFKEGEQLGEIVLNVPGLHNVRNSLVAVSIGLELGIGFNIIKSALGKYSGVSRRFEIKAEINDILVIDDYAHHPTEVAATLSALRTGWKRKVIAVFQPHLYTRTRDFYNEFAEAFLNCDIFVCTDVYPAREKPIEGINGKLIIEAAIKKGHKNAIYTEDKNSVAERVLKLAEPGDIVITLGAGDIWKYGEEIIDRLKVVSLYTNRNQINKDLKNE